MANRIPLVLEAGRTQQHQPDDTLHLRTDVVSGAAKLLLVATDGGEAISFEIRVYDDTLMNLAFGINAGAAITTGSNNICLGASAGSALTTGINNTAIGFQAMQDLSGAFNSNTAIGPNALRELNSASGGGNNNSAIGPSALRDLLTGSNNVAIGTSSMIAATNADSNTAVGQSSLSLLTTGDENVGIGLQAGRSLTTGSQNTFIGRLAGNIASQKVDAMNTFGIGNQSFSTADNQGMIGNTSITQEILRGTIDVCRLTNPCRVNIYNTAAADPPGTSFELAAIRWDTNVAKVGTHKGAGGGSARDFAIETDGVTRMTFGSAGGITVADTENFVFSTSTGTKFGTATGQKIGFWNATPIIQPASANQAALNLDLDVTGVDTVDKAAIDANFAAIQTLVNQLRADLVSAGLIKGAA